VIQRATNAGFTTGLVSVQPTLMATTYTDTTVLVNGGLSYWYRVLRSTWSGACMRIPQRDDVVGTIQRSGGGAACGIGNSLPADPGHPDGQSCRPDVGVCTHRGPEGLCDPEGHELGLHCRLVSSTALGTATTFTDTTVAVGKTLLLQGPGDQRPGHHSLVQRQVHHYSLREWPDSPSKAART